MNGLKTLVEHERTCEVATWWARPPDAIDPTPKNSKSRFLTGNVCCSSSLYRAGDALMPCSRQGVDKLTRGGQRGPNCKKVPCLNIAPAITSLVPSLVTGTAVPTILLTSTNSAT